MSGQSSWERAISEIEQELGRSLTSEERDCLEPARLKWAQRTFDLASRATFSREPEFVDLIRRMVDRQATVTPDFDSLYRKKDELDRKLSDP